VFHCAALIRSESPGSTLVKSGTASHLDRDRHRHPVHHGVPAERDHAAQGQVMGDLLEAFRKDPAFHSFSVAMLAFPAPRGSERFQQGLAAINAADGCDKTNPSCQNQPRWAHNMESFETFRADYELKAGNTQKARAILASVKTIPGYSEWPYKAAVEERLDERAALFANADPKDDPALLVVGKGSCGSCHRSR
jgi:hypothetical protein